MPFDPSCIDVEDFLDCLEIRNVRRITEKEIRFSCPYPAHVKGDQDPSANMNVETTKFFCHSCHAKGNAITFTADVLGVDPIHAIRMLKQRYSPRGIDPDSRNMLEEIRKILYKPKPVKRMNRILPESVLDRYAIDWGRATDPAWYMGERGFSAKTLEEWQFGWSEKHKRITLPIRDEHGRLVGIKARALNDRKPKYLNLKDEENDIDPYLKNEVLFALDRALAWNKYDGTLIIIEGELNTVAMHQLGYRNTVALNGSYFGERQIRLIKQYADRAILFFDSDQAGYDATVAVANALQGAVFVSVCPEHYGDPADMHPGAVRRCLEGARGYLQVRLGHVL